MTKTNGAKAKVVDQIISRLEEAQRDGLELPWWQLESDKI